jgi:hypothetical protein
MPINSVALANTFNEFRTTVNEVITTLNGVSGGSGVINANTLVGGTVTANNLTSGRVTLSGTAGQIVDDSALTYNTSTDVLTLGGTADATAANNGTLVVSGGVGVAKKLFVGTDLRVDGTTTFAGNVVFLGSNVAISTTNLQVNDPIIHLANNNVSDAVDIGFHGQYNQGGANLHSGFFRDASDDTWKLFRNYNIEPAAAIDITTNGFEWANLAIGSLIANTNATIGGTLAVTGAATLSSTLALTGNLNVNTNRFNVTASSGNTAIAGTLGVTGATTLSSTLGVTGNTTVGGTLGVTGAVTLSNTASIVGNLSVNTNKFTVEASSGNTVIAGNATINGNLSIDGNVVLGNTATDIITIGANTLTLNTDLNVNSGKFFFSQSNTRFGVNTSTPIVSLDINTTDGLALPAGTTGQRPATVKTGIIRYNITTSKPEIYDGTDWKDVGGGGGATVAFAYFLAANL